MSGVLSCKSSLGISIDRQTEKTASKRKFDLRTCIVYAQHVLIGKLRAAIVPRQGIFLYLHLNIVVYISISIVTVDSYS